MRTQSATKAPRTLVLCFDGTGDWIGTDQTNIAKLFTLLDEDPDLCYYDGGVGTLLDYNAVSPFKRLFLRLLDLANATGLREKVLQGYRFLVRNYRVGDRIYLFGFSRGAYTARLVAALVQSFGVLRPSAENVAPYLWQAFVAPGGFDAFKAGAKRLRERFALAEPVTIRFMGLFDTVSSVGLLSRFNVYPFTTYNQGVERTCHAVSIGESRNMFPENLMDPKQPNLTEVWFPGIHRDVGGGYPPARSRIADEALDWMATEAARAGLRLGPWPKPDPACPPTPNEPTFDPYVFFGTVPLQIPSADVKGKRYYWPNFRSVRAIPEGALVHEVALLAYGTEQGRPVNFPKTFVSFGTGSEALTDDLPCTAKPPPWPAELIGIVFGIVLVLFVWNALVGSILGESWPRTKGWIDLGLLLLVVPVQGVGRATVHRLPRPLRFEPVRLFPGTAALVLLAVFLVTGPTRLFLGGLLAGGIVWVLAAFLGLPPLRADRALPYYLFAALLSASLVGVCSLVSGWLPWLRPDPVGTSILGAAAFLGASALILRDRWTMRARTSGRD